MSKILLVDDEPEISQVFETALSQAGHEIHTAVDAKSAFEAAKAESFDLFILDQMLPDLSGNEILKVLKKDERTKNTPVAMLSNFGHDDMIKEALNSGATDYILKYQVSTDDLIEKVGSMTPNASSATEQSPSQEGNE